MYRGFGERRSEGNTNQDESSPSNSSVSRLPSHSTWSRSPTLVSKRAASTAIDEGYGAREDLGRIKIYSPSGLKRRRADSDMSIAAATGESPGPYGSVRITSTSIHSVVHTADHERGGWNRGDAVDDGGNDERTSFSWRSSQGSGRDSFASSLADDDRAVDDSFGDADRPFVSNASRNITFAMLQQHFTKPLKDAASHFGVCTTLLKKVCRKNGIVSWPYRQIIGLQKSIVSMEQQVQYFDGDQRRQYIEQLAKLHIKLSAFIRTGEAPSEETILELLQEDKGKNAPYLNVIHGDAQVDRDTYRFNHPHRGPDRSPGFQRPGSVMASAVTIEDDEYIRPLGHVRERSIYESEYVPSHPSLAQPRPLPPISFMLNQQLQSRPDAQQQSYPSYNFHTPSNHRQW